MCGADLSKANLCGANLSEAELSEAKLNGATIDDTTQIGAKFRFVWELVNSGASGRDLRLVDLRGTHL